MNVTQSKPSMSKGVFEALLLIYASHVDYDFSVDEKNNIIEAQGYNAYESALMMYNSSREYEILQNICDLRRLYYPGDDGKVAVLNKVKSHFNVDGEYSKLEKTQFDFLRMML